jgi:calcineurin-like phosphoesterase family protein
MTEFFTSDQHYYHGRIIFYCTRPFTNIKQMHDVLITRHNEVVSEEDTVWGLGDMFMLAAERQYQAGKIIEKLNGQQHLVLGSHDEFKPFNYIKMGITSVHTSMWLERDGYKFVLAHDPSIYTIVQNMGEKTYMLCGHVHNLFKHLLPEKRVINVGVDVWDYRPVSFEEILKLIEEYK